MPEPTRKLNLHLDPDTLAELERHISDDVRRGHCNMSAGSCFVLDSASSEPGRSSLFSRVKSQLGPYIDFEGGGLKLYEFNHKGEKGTFSLKPGWDKGGPNVMLQFHMRF